MSISKDIIKKCLSNQVEPTRKFGCFRLVWIIKIAKCFIVSDLAIFDVGSPGFEPRMTEPKPVVLPLHHDPIAAAKLVLFSATTKFLGVFFDFPCVLPLFSPF